jgi:serine/threonine protein phosphatase PrpC
MYVCMCIYNCNRVLAAVQANEAKTNTNVTQLPGSTDTTRTNPAAKSGLLAPLASHTVGSVAVLALLYKPKQTQQIAPTAVRTPNKTTVYVASVGDCRCVLSRGGQAIAVTDDHKVRGEVLLLPRIAIVHFH